MTEQEKQMWQEDIEMIKKLNTERNKLLEEIERIKKFYNNKVNELYKMLDKKDEIIKDLLILEKMEN